MLWMFAGIAVGYVLLGIALHVLYYALERTLNAYVEFAVGADSPSSNSYSAREVSFWQWFNFWFWPFPGVYILLLLLLVTVIILVFRLPLLFSKWVGAKPWIGWSKRWRERRAMRSIVEKKPSTRCGGYGW